VLTKKTSFKKLNHVAYVSSVTIRKIISLQHFNFFNFTIWMPPALDTRGRGPDRPLPPSVRHCRQGAWIEHVVNYWATLEKW